MPVVSEDEQRRREADAVVASLRNYVEDQVVTPLTLTGEGVATIEELVQKKLGNMGLDPARMVCEIQKFTDGGHKNLWLQGAVRLRDQREGQ